MRVAITGGAGFIGSWLCDAELACGSDVICVDNLFTGRRENIVEPLRSAKFEFVRHDVCEPIHAEVDRIYHLACPAAPLHYSRNPARTIETAVLGTLNVLRWAREVGARLVVASTSEVYGNPTVHPQPETYFGNVNPVSVRACYDEGKRAAEALCHAYFTQFGTDVRVARIFNTYGPRMAGNDGRVIPAFIASLRLGKPIVLHSGGQQTRSFCFVRDTIDAIRALMDLDSLSHSLTMPVVNIGNPHEIQIRDLAAIIARLCGKPDHPIARADHPIGDDPERRCPDISRAQAWLGWSPEVSLEEGLMRTLRWAGLLHSVEV